MSTKSPAKSPAKSARPAAKAPARGAKSAVTRAPAAKRPARPPAKAATKTAKAPARGAKPAAKAAAKAPARPTAKAPARAPAARKSAAKAPARRPPAPPAVATTPELDTLIAERAEALVVDEAPAVMAPPVVVVDDEPAEAVAVPEAPSDPEPDPEPEELAPEEWYRREKARRTRPATADVMAEARALLLQAVAEAGPRRGRPVRVGAAAKGKPTKKLAPDEFELEEYRPGEPKAREG